ncbi:MAG: PEP-CTERM sorting domain-containing protein [Colwellia sp.]
MIKLIIKVVFPVFFLISSSAFAGLITTDLAEDTYVTYGGYDWTWASPVNSENYNGALPGETNVLYGPSSFNRNWQFIEGNTLQALFSELTLDLFKKTDGSLITSIVYWNSFFTDTTESNFYFKSSVWVDDSAMSFFRQFDTFYVRNIADRPTAQVPEPSTLMIFAIALIALSLRKRAIQ